MNNFNPQPPLKPTPLPTVPGATDDTPWGFYWSIAGDGGIASRSSSSWLYNSDLSDLWKLYSIQQNIEAVEWAVEVTTEAAAKWTQEKIDKLEDVAKKTGTKIKVISINAFETAVEVADFVTDNAKNAIWEYATSGEYGPFGVLKLFINSEAITTINIDIPVDANSMRLSFEYLLADKGCILEVFINDISVYQASSNDFLGEGMQDSDWIDVSSWSGKQVKLSFRLSNPIDGKQGVVALDDLLFAKVFPFVDNDEDGILDGDDNCPDNYNPSQTDSDGDGVGDLCDNCPDTANPDQADSDSDGIGDECESITTPGDLDGDGDIDRDDLNIILSYRNQPASVCPECDLDGDGMITALDARKLVLLCTCPRCVCP